MSRLGRSQPVQPSAWHGFVDPGPGPVGTVPRRPVVVENDNGRRKSAYWPLPAVSISGVLASFLQLFVSPPLPVVVDANGRGRAKATPDAKTSHGFVDSGVGVPGTAPPAPVSVDRADQRVRYRPQDPIALNGLLASLASTPSATPPGPFVVTVDERRRFLAALPPTVAHGFDDVDPPPPNVSELDDRRRRYRPLEPVVLSGVLAPFLPPIVMPPEPLVVVGEDGRRRMVLKPIVLSGPAFPTQVVAAIYTQRFGPPSPTAIDLGGVPTGNAFAGSPDNLELVGVPGGNQFRSPKPGRA